MNPDDFNIEEIEQMEPEFKECPHCGGAGHVDNGVIFWHCPLCHGTGEVEIAKEGEN